MSSIIRLLIIVLILLATEHSIMAVADVEYSASTVCHILTPSDLQNWDDDSPKGLISCYDLKTGMSWEEEIDVLSVGLWRIVTSIVIDSKRNRLYAWAKMKKGGPGWRIFDLNTLAPIKTNTPLARLDGVDPKLFLVDNDNYLVLFYHDSTSYIDTYSPDNNIAYIFNAESLELISQVKGINRKIDDKIFAEASNPYIYIESRTNNSRFPVVHKILLPQFSYVDSILTVELFQNSFEYIEIVDVKNDRILMIGYKNMSGNADSPSDANIIVFDLKGHKVLSISPTLKLNIFSNAKFSGSGEYYFMQYGKSDSLSVFNSVNGDLSNTFYKLASNALGVRSFVDGDDLYIVNEDHSMFKVINARTALLVKEIKIKKFEY